MKATTLFLFLVTIVVASPENYFPDLKQQGPDCAIKNYDDAFYFVGRFITVLLGLGSDLNSNSTETAEAILNDGFVVYSHSTRSISSTQQDNDPRPQYYKNDYLNATALHHEFDKVSIDTYDVVAGCDSIVWRWEYDGYGSGYCKLRGFHYFVVKDVEAVGLQAVEADIEYDSVCALLNLGGGIYVNNHEGDVKD